MRWDAFVGEAPELAELGRERIESRHLALVGSLRRDGWPRISPAETYLVGGELLIGMMWQSRKAVDLLRDPRLSVHSIVTDWEGSEGDFKLCGIAEEVHDQPRRQALFNAIDAAHGEPPDPEASGDPDEFHVFAVDIDRAGFVRFGESTWEAWRLGSASGAPKAGTALGPPDPTRWEHVEAGCFARHPTRSHKGTLARKDLAC